MSEKKEMHLTGQPFGKRILVFPDNAERVSRGGIIIPDSAQEKPSAGTIVQVGYDNEKKEPLNVQVGQRCLYGKYSGMEIEFEEGTVLLMYESDLVYVWPKNEVDAVDQQIKRKTKRGATVL